MTSPKMITAEGRVSFPNVFKPDTIPGSDAEPKFSCSLLLEKEDPDVKKFIKKLKTAIDEEKKATWPKGAPRKNFKICLIDGDDEGELEASKGVSEGFHILKMSSRTKPEVIQSNGEPIINPADFYAGCRARASVVVRAYTKGSNGVAAHFNNFMKTGDDEPFGQGSAKASEDFADYIDSEGYDGDDEGEGIDI